MSSISNADILQKIDNRPGGLIAPFSVPGIVVPTAFHSLDDSPSGRCNLAGCENNGVSPRALAAVQNPTSDMLVKHWKSQDRTLRAKLAAIHDVSTEQVILTSGAANAIHYSHLVLGTNAKMIGLASPEWPGLRFYADTVLGAERVWLKRTQFPFQFEVDDLAAEIRGQGIDFITLSNPSACTGRFWSSDEVESLLEACPNTMFVIDEADSLYPDLSSARLVNQYRNVTFLESLSKFYGLSGLRIGYMVIHCDYVEDFKRMVNPVELTSIAIVAAREAVEDIAYQRTTQQETKKNRVRLTNFLKETHYKLAPNSACFAAYLYADDPYPDPWQELAELGVDLVPGSWFGLERGCRLNLRDSESIDVLIETLKILESASNS